MNQMIQFSKSKMQRVNELVASVQAGELTADEAGMSLAGWMLKNHPRLQREMSEQEKDSNYKVALLDIESRLPGFDGLVLGRHI